jgi:xanthine dehydrogenase iron-sulfur cluster and FAD-binding subunit A
VAGSTDVGLWVNKQFRDLGDMIYVGDVAEMKRIEVRPDAEGGECTSAPRLRWKRPGARWCSAGPA